MKRTVSVPDLILSDFHLGPGDTGLDVIENVRALGGRPIPAILVTGDTSPEVNVASTDKIQLLTKPGDPEQLLSLTETLCRPSGESSE